MSIYVLKMYAIFVFKHSFNAPFDVACLKKTLKVYNILKLILLQEQLYHLLSLDKELVQFGWIMCSVLHRKQNY